MHIINKNLRDRMPTIGPRLHFGTAVRAARKIHFGKGYAFGIQKPFGGVAITTKR